MSDNKLKVTLICHFSNPMVRSRLRLVKSRTINTLRRMLAKPEKEYRDYAPWITGQLKELGNRHSIEMHVIAPHNGLKGIIQEFVEQGIHYHFFRPLNKSLLFRLLPNGTSVQWLSLYPNRIIMRRFIKSISPDIVNISGSENPYYSVSALDIDNIPLLITAQTVYANPSRQALSGHVNNFRWELELEIFKKTKYYASGATMHRDLILQHRPDAIVLKVQGSAPMVPAFAGRKEFDFAFFAAQVTPKKGITDALEAFSKVRETCPDVSLNIIGSWEPGFMNELCPGLEVGKLREGILYSGYFENHDDMLRQVQKSRFALLPVKLDAVSGTIRESMLMGLPIVTYRTSGTPALNKDRENVLLADIGDTETLAINMLRLLEDAEFARCISDRAKEYAENEFSYKKNTAQWIAVLEAVHQHYYKKSEIPKDLLFRADGFQAYK